MNQDTGSAAVYRRCGCLDPTTRRRLGNHCPKLADPGHGSWYYTVQIPDQGGRPCRQRLGGFTTAVQASRARARTLATYTRTGTTPRRTCTVAAWLRQWLTTLPDQV